MKKSESHQRLLLLGGILLSATLSFFYWQKKTQRDQDQNRLSWHKQLWAKQSQLQELAKQPLQTANKAFTKLHSGNDRALADQEPKVLDVQPVTTGVSVATPAAAATPEPEAVVMSDSAKESQPAEQRLECQVIINYVDEEREPLAPSETLTGKAGTNYTTTYLPIRGYLLKKRSANAQGQFQTAPQNVYYIYLQDHAYHD